MITTTITATTATAAITTGTTGKEELPDGASLVCGAVVVSAV